MANTVLIQAILTSDEFIDVTISAPGIKSAATIKLYRSVFEWTVSLHPKNKEMKRSICIELDERYYAVETVLNIMTAPGTHGFKHKGILSALATQKYLNLFCADSKNPLVKNHGKALRSLLGKESDKLSCLESEFMLGDYSVLSIEKDCPMFDFSMISIRQMACKDEECKSCTQCMSVRNVMKIYKTLLKTKFPLYMKLEGFGPEAKEMVLSQGYKNLIEVFENGIAHVL